MSDCLAMDSTKQKTFRSKSLNSQRVSIRRKNSFNKVRQLFENNSKSSQTNRCSDNILNNNSLEELGIPSKYDSLKEIEEKVPKIVNNNEMTVSKNVVCLTNNVRPIDDKFIQNTNDCRLVKNKISFFENKSTNEKTGSKMVNTDDNKNNGIINLNKDSQFGDNFMKNYGNKDKIANSNQVNDDCNRDTQILNTLKEGIPIDLKNKDKYLFSSDDLQQTSINLSNIEPNYKRSLSISSVSSLTSDFVSFDSEPEVIFRKPNIRTQTLKTRPTPRQRTSILKSKQNYKIKNLLYISN